MGHIEDALNMLAANAEAEFPKIYCYSEPEILGLALRQIVSSSNLNLSRRTTSIVAPQLAASLSRIVASYHNDASTGAPPDALIRSVALCQATYFENQNFQARQPFNRSNRSSVNISAEDWKSLNQRVARNLRAGLQFVASAPATSDRFTYATSDDVLKAINESMLSAIQTMGSNLDEIRGLTAGMSLDQWRKYRIFQSAALATPALAGFISYATLVVEISLLLRFIYNSALGVGFIRNGVAYDEDFLNIFYGASNKGTFTAENAKKVAAMALAQGGQAALAKGSVIGFKLIANSITTILSIKTAGKVALPALTKMSTWLAKVLAGPAVARAVPIIGGLVSGFANGWVTSSFLDASEDYYGFVKTVEREMRR